jgi:lipopolysaccharide export system permease protein
VPAVRLLDRYLLRELLTPLAVCLGGFLIFWVSFDLFSELNSLQERHLRAGEILQFELYRLPQFLAVVMPVALLLALLYALTQHAKHHELTAIRAAGISLLRLSAPYLAVGVAASLALFAVNECVAPAGADAANALLASHLPGSHRAADPFKKVYFSNSADNRIWALDYNVATREMRAVLVDWQRTDGSRLIFSADSGVRSNGVWVFFNVQSHLIVPTNVLPVNRILTNVLAMPEFTETPAQIKSEITISIESGKARVERTQIALADLYRYIRLHPRQDAKDSWVHTQFHSRLATPWTCLVVVLIAIPFGAMTGRRNIFFGVAGSIFIFFVYYVLLQVGLTLGSGGRLPAALAAWLPNLFFGLAGMILTLRVR